MRKNFSNRGPERVQQRELSRFPKLPTELRLKIYSFTENFKCPPRWFSVAPRKDDFDNEAPSLTVLRKGAACNQQIPYTTMSVCSEARQEALRVHVKWSSMGVVASNVEGQWWLDTEFDGQPVCVDPKNDIFYVGDGPWKLNEYALPNGHGTNNLVIDSSQDVPTNDCNAEALSKVEHLAVGFETLSRADRQRQGEFMRSTANFPSLKDLTVVVPSYAVPSFINSYEHDEIRLALTIDFENNSLRTLRTRTNRLIERRLQRSRFDADGYFGNVSSAPKCQRLSQLLQNYIEHLFDEFVDKDHLGTWKRPEIKVVFHICLKSNFLGHTDSHRQGVPYAEEGEFDKGERWEKYWSDGLERRWGDEFTKIRESEASLDTLLQDGGR